jgi:4-hydroxy-L-threonine phosphate dehydrogenase PdxA
MIAIEILADEDKWLDLGGVDIMLSFSLIHDSVDRGTAFDIAGKGVLNSSSLVEAID